MLVWRAVEVEGCGCARHDFARDREALPREGKAYRENQEIGDPDAQAKELEQRAVEEIGAGGVKRRKSR